MHVPCSVLYRTRIGGLVYAFYNVYTWNVLPDVHILCVHCACTVLCDVLNMYILCGVLYMHVLFVALSMYCTVYRTAYVLFGVQCLYCELFHTCIVRYTKTLHTYIAGPATPATSASAGYGASETLLKMEAVSCYHSLASKQFFLYFVKEPYLPCIVTFTYLIFSVKSKHIITEGEPSLHLQTANIIGKLFY